jgi:hypothetical protein
MPFPTIAANPRKRPKPQLHGFKGSERRLHFWIGASRLPGANKAHPAGLSRYVAHAGEAGGREGGAEP